MARQTPLSEGAKNFNAWLDGRPLSPLCVSLSLSVFSHSLSSDILARLAGAGLFAKRKLQEQEQEQLLLLPSLLLLLLLHKATEFIIMKFKKKHDNSKLPVVTASRCLPACLSFLPASLPAR